MTRTLWLIVFAGIALFLYIVKGALLPFLFGLAVAYFLDPVADQLEKRKISRGAAAAIVIALSFLLVVGFFVALWPVLHSQLIALSAAVPQALASLKPWINNMSQELSSSFGVSITNDPQDILANFSDEIFARLRDAASGIISGGLAIVNLLTLALISPVVAFYLLRDWDRIVAQIDSWLPPSRAAVIREQFGKIDDVLAGFVRGQLTACVVMAALYAIGWSITGLNYGLILGLLAGVLAFIPFVGALFAAGVATLVALGQWGFAPLPLGLVIGVFVIVQVIEAAILTPRLVGQHVGLHPVWVLFALFAGGEFLGFIGVLISIPAAASIAVLVRYALDRYLEHYNLPRLDDGQIVDDDTVPSKSQSKKSKQNNGQTNSA